MGKKQNKTYGELRLAEVKALVEGSEYNKSTAHTQVDAAIIDKMAPEGITQDSMRRHVAFAKDVGSVLEVANAEVARTARAENDKIEKTDMSASWGGIDFHTEHQLRQKLGEEDYLYGSSTTMMDLHHTPEQAAWLEETRASSMTLAENLFK